MFWVMKNMKEKKQVSIYGWNRLTYSNLSRYFARLDCSIDRQTHIIPFSFFFYSEDRSEIVFEKNTQQLLIRHITFPILRLVWEVSKIKFKKKQCWPKQIRSVSATPSFRKTTQFHTQQCIKNKSNVKNEWMHAHTKRLSGIRHWNYKLRK